MNITFVPSPNLSERPNKASVQFLVLHYTAVSAEETWKIFRDKSSKASAHYTILDKPTDDEAWIYQHVQEEQMAWHAGVSYWRGIQNVNSHSIGIEHVSLGHRWREDYPLGGTIKVPGWHELFYPLPDGQIEAAVPLYKKIIQKYNIHPWNILGHDMIALPYGRKIDPGPLFPWKWLARTHNIGLWPDFAQSSYHISPDEASKLLQKIGFQVNAKEDLLGATRAFQMHWRPTNVSGTLDEETQNRIVCIAQCIPDHIG